MDKGQFIDVGSFDETVVDCTRTPNSAEEYLRQVVVSRARCPDFVSASASTTPSKPISHPGLQSIAVERQDTRNAMQKTWLEEKSADFSRKRQQIATAPRCKLEVKLPSLSDIDSWQKVILEECIPEFAHLFPQFPNHTGTPPITKIVTNLSQTQVNALIEFIVEWARSEGFSRPLREWLYALMLVVDTPLLHDVVAALREVAKMCKDLRRGLRAEDADDIAEMSLFVAIVAIYFGQRDLSD